MLYNKIKDNNTPLPVQCTIMLDNKDKSKPVLWSLILYSTNNLVYNVFWSIFRFKYSYFCQQVSPMVKITLRNAVVESDI